MMSVFRIYLDMLESMKNIDIFGQNPAILDFGVVNRQKCTFFKKKFIFALPT